VNYLVKVRRLLPEQIAVFAQQDAYGDAGFAGVEKAIRSLRGGNETPILRLHYQRNTVDVDAPDYVSLEGYVDASVLIAALQRNGAQLDTEGLVGSLENLRDLDIGLGTPVIFSRSDHQGVHKVWGTQLDETGHYQPVDLQ
jgi:ABC-type branched-subunit amino acid transport system substrate-binding protein